MQKAGHLVRTRGSRGTAGGTWLQAQAPSTPFPPTKKPRSSGDRLSVAPPSSQFLPVLAHNTLGYPVSVCPCVRVCPRERPVGVLAGPRACAVSLPCSDAPTTQTSAPGLVRRACVGPSRMLTGPLRWLRLYKETASNLPLACCVFMIREYRGQQREPQPGPVGQTTPQWGYEMGGWGER